MPSSPGYRRNYRQEYSTARKRGEVDAGPNGDNAKRKAARRKLQKAGVNVAGKDVDHKNGNPQDNSRGNLKVKSKAANRSFRRNKNAGKATVKPAVEPSFSQVGMAKGGVVKANCGASMKPTQKGK